MRNPLTSPIHEYQEWKSPKDNIFRIFFMELLDFTFYFLYNVHVIEHIRKISVACFICRNRREVYRKWSSHE